MSMSTEPSPASIADVLRRMPCRLYCRVAWRWKHRVSEEKRYGPSCQEREMKLRNKVWWVIQVLGR